MIRMNDFLKQLIDSIPAVITGIIALFSGYLVARTGKKGVRENDFIEKLHKEVQRLTERIDLQDAKIDALIEENHRYEEYISILRQHIIQQLPPPPPPNPYWKSST